MVSTPNLKKIKKKIQKEIADENQKVKYLRVNNAKKIV